MSNTFVTAFDAGFHVDCCLPKEKPAASQQLQMKSTVDMTPGLDTARLSHQEEQCMKLLLLQPKHHSPARKHMLQNRDSSG